MNLSRRCATAISRCSCAFGVFLDGLAKAREAGGDGLEEMRRGVEALRELNIVFLDGLIKIALAEAEGGQGGFDPALAALDEALATAKRIGYRAFAAGTASRTRRNSAQARPRQPRALSETQGPLTPPLPDRERGFASAWAFSFIVLQLSRAIGFGWSIMMGARSFEDKHAVVASEDCCCSGAEKERQQNQLPAN